MYALVVMRPRAETQCSITSRHVDCSDEEGVQNRGASHLLVMMMNWRWDKDDALFGAVGLRYCVLLVSRQCWIEVRVRWKVCAVRRKTMLNFARVFGVFITDNEQYLGVRHGVVASCAMSTASLELSYGFQSCWCS